MKFKADSFKRIQDLFHQTVNGEFCDVILKVENEDFHAHKSMLASQSEYFSKMFTLDMKEKRDKTVPIIGVTADAFRQVLNWIYLAQVDVTDSNVLSLHRASSMMQLNDLLDVVKRYLIDRIEDVFSENDDLDLTYDEFHEILSSDELNVSDEKSLFELIIKWVENDIEGRRKKFESLFELVRLQLISLDYLHNVIRKHKLVQQFPKCQELVEEAIYKIGSGIVSQLSRHNTTPDVLLVIPSSCKYFDKIPITSKRQIRCFNKMQGLWSVAINCAVAEKYPIIAFCGGPSMGFSTKAVVKFDGKSWMRMPEMCTARVGCAATFFGKDLYVFGGETVSYGGFGASRGYTSGTQACLISESNEKLVNGLDRKETPQIDKQPTEKIMKPEWDQLSFQTKPRSYFAAQAINDRIYLIGGYSTVGHNHSYNDTIIFYPLQNCSINGAPMKEARAKFACATFQMNIYVCGGIGNNGSSLCSIEYLNLSTNVWTSVKLSSPLTFGPIPGCYVIGDKLYFKNNEQTVFVYEPESKTVDIFCQINPLLSDTSSLLLPFDECRMKHLF